MEVEPNRPLHRETFVALAGLLALAAMACLLVAVGGAWRDQTPRDPVYRLNVNKATAGQLQTLPRVGPTTAEHIVTYGLEHGPFRNVEQLDDVRLIGPITLERLEPWITFD